MSPPVFLPRNKLPRPHLIWYFLATIASLIPVIHFLGGTSFDIAIPRATGGDGLFYLQVAKRLVDIDGYLVSSALGAPYGASLYDFPLPEGLSLAFLYLAGKLTATPATAVNLYYIVGFPLATIAFIAVAREFKVTAGPSIVGGLLFSCLPFHFFRFGHLFYTWYFVVPIFVWYGLKIYQVDVAKLKDLRWKKIALLILGLTIISSTGVYFAVFGMTIFIVASILGSVEGRRASMTAAFCACVIVACTVLANTAPTLLFWAQNGKNKQVAARVAEESDMYGLKVVQLLLPHQQHSIEKLREINAKYSARFPLVTENSLSSLGIVGSVGLLVLLWYAIFAKRDSSAPKPLFFIAVLTLVLILVASIGGFASLFALTVSPMIRAWNRVSIVIAFTSLIAVMMVLSWQLARLQRVRLHRFFSGVTLAAVLLFGLFDQSTLRCGSACNEKLKSAHQSNTAFFDRLQNTLPQGTLIVNLPFMEFPETPPRHDLNDYSQFDGYLYTRGFKWSYGAMRGRDRGDILFRDLDTKPLPAQIEVVKSLGFKAILVDRRGYKDQGYVVERELKASGLTSLVLAKDFRALYAIND